MFRLIRATLPGALFFLMVLQYKEVEKLKAENVQLKAMLHGQANADAQVKEALQLASQGKKEDAVSRLRIISREFSASAAGKEAGREAQRLQEQLDKERAEANARLAAERNKKDLEKILNGSTTQPPQKPALAKPPAEPGKELQVASCKKLESDSNKYAGKRIVITDNVEQLDSYFNFSDCSGIRLSTERLGKDGVSGLRSKLAGKDSAEVTLSGEYSGLVFYLEKVK